MGTWGLIQVGKGCAIAVYTDGNYWATTALATWLKKNFSGLYNGISSNKPFNMMNGPEDFNMRLVCGMKAMYVERKNRINRMAGFPQMNHDAILNSEVGGIYLLDNPVEPKDFSYTTQIKIEKIPGVDEFSSKQTHKLLFITTGEDQDKGEEEMDLETFIQKYKED